MHLAILREDSLPAEDRPRAEAGRAVLMGRDDELAAAQAAWAEVGADQDGHLLLVEGEAGIGKTRLLDAVADFAAATGGRVLRGRCHPAERSLFLQPYVDALRPALLDAPTARLSALVRDHEASWVALVPELGAVLPAPPPLPSDVDLQRRAAYDAVLAVLRRLALDQPVLLVVDDLQDGGAATVDLLGYLAARLGPAPVLVLAAVRAEDVTTVDRLADRARRVRLGALPRSAVDALAAAAGLGSHGEQVMARTAGHPLSVVEYLRALASGDAGVPASLAEAVLTRVGRLEPGLRAVVEAAAVVRRRLDPRLLADLVEASEVATVRHCEDLVRQRLLVRSGDHYEFANDLLQECVHASLAPAVALAYHRRAADLVSGQPELMAEHAYAAGDEPRAAQGWLLAGEDALRRAAVEDALGLLDRSLGVTTAFAGTRARALLARSSAYEALTAYDDALADIDAALALARAHGDHRLEMASLRARGGDPAVALLLPTDEVADSLQQGLRLAAALGDRPAEADFTTRLVILDASRLRLTDALDRAERGVARARAASSEEAYLLALDGLKTALTYLGDTDRLAAVLDELEPLVRVRDDTWILQWVIFERSYVAAADGRLDEARRLVADALAINARSGFPAFAGYMLAHDGWFARLAGDLPAARRVGRQAVAATSAAHPWWYATPAGILAATLIETGEPAEAETVARRGLATTSSEEPTAGRLRCLAALAVVTGDPDVVAEATRALGAVDCPPGRAWVTGADVYLLLGATEPLRAATEHAWPEIRSQITSSTS